MRKFIKNPEGAVAAFISKLESEKENAHGGRVTSIAIAETIKPFVSPTDLQRRVQEVAQIIVNNELAPIIADERGYRLAPTSQHLLDAAEKNGKLAWRYLERKTNYTRLAAKMRREEESKQLIHAQLT